MHFSFIWKKYKYKQQNVLLVSKVKVLIMQTAYIRIIYFIGLEL